MGATTFAVSYKGTKTKKSAQKCFDTLVEYDRIVYGHDAYTGDIGQKSSFKIMEHKFRKDYKVHDWTEELIETEFTDPWDKTCGAVWLPQAKKWCFFGWCKE